MNSIETKLEEAYELLNQFITDYGIQASLDRYKGQLWTRDFCHVVRSLINTNDKTLIKTIIKHAVEITNHQEENGKVPILFIDGDKNILNFLKEKIEKSEKSNKMSFMLKKLWNDGKKGIENLTDHTRDSELMFIIAANEILVNFNSYLSEDETMKIKNGTNLALSYVLDKTKNGEMFMKGGDWRDTRDDLDDKEVLSNAVLLYKCLSYNNHNAADKILIKLNEFYWNGNYFKDYPNGGDKFDILGNAYAIIYGVATIEQSRKIIEYSMNLKTEYGFKLEDTFLPSLNVDEENDMMENKAVIWPYLNFILLEAMLRTDINYKEIVIEYLNKFSKMKGFNEWYSITTGKPFGSHNQLWTIVYYIRLTELIKYNK